MSKNYFNKKEINGNALVKSIINPLFNDDCVQFKKPQWVICHQSCKKQAIDDFIIIDRKSERSIEFCLGKSNEVQQTLRIPERHFNSKGIFQPTSETYDLEILCGFFGEGQKKAIEYCISGYAELDEKELCVFLVACSILKVEHPFQLLDTYFSKSQKIDLKIDSFENIFPLFAQHLKQLKEKNLSQSLQYKVISLYQSKIMDCNPYFFIEGSFFPDWLGQIDETNFLDVFILHASKTLLNLTEGYSYISFQQVEIFYQLLAFYYSTQLTYQVQGNAEIVFQAYFENEIKQKFAEEDQMLCIQFLPSGKNILHTKAIEIIQENNRLKQREAAYIDLIIQKFGIESSKTELLAKFSQSMKIVTGNQVDKQIEALFNSRVDEAKKF